MATIGSSLGVACFRALLFAAMALLPAAALDASPFLITIDTSALAGTTVDLALDFVDGGPPANHVDITDFITDGTLGAAVLSGGASGALPGPAVLSDTSLFNEILQSITLANSISFVIKPTQNGPSGGSAPDAMSIFLLDRASGLPLFATEDITGGDALLLFEIVAGGKGQATVYAATSTPEAVLTIAAVPPPPGSVPIAPTSLLLLAGLAALVLLRPRVRRRH